MSFVSYPYLILQISGQILQVTVACQIFWELNGLSVTRATARRQSCLV